MIVWDISMEVIVDGMKYLLVIGDGMADRPVPRLGGKTPLDYAETPAMDRLASAGTIGTALTVPEGMTPGSDPAILSIFGCDPRVCMVGRAPLEAAAMDVRLQAGAVAYRCNMITFEDSDKPFEEKKIVSHSAGAINGETSNALVRELFGAPGFKEAAEKAGIHIYPGSSFRHIAVQKSPDLTGLSLTPPHDHLGEALGQHLPRGGENAATLEKLMRLAHGILDKHPRNEARRSEGKFPANGIWFWSFGTSIELPSFPDKYGKTGAVISAVPLCQGIGALIGLDRIFVEGATGELNTNYEGKADAAIEALKTRDFAAIHIEAPDECTHMGDTPGKVLAIERIDRRVIARLMERLATDGIDYRMLVISDHRTLTSTRGHDGSPVPFAIYDSRVDNRSGARFRETDAELGRYLDDGTQLMGLLFSEGMA